MKIVSVSVAIAALIATASVRAEEKPVQPVQKSDWQTELAEATANLYVDVTSGIANPDDGGKELLSTSIGAHSGHALTKFNNNAVLGLQLGGAVGLTETDSDAHRAIYSSEIGLFVRGIPCKYNQTAAAAVLFTYDRNQHGSDILALRPLLGVTLDEKNSIGGKGVAHINQNNGDRATDSGAGFWVHKWNDRFSSEATLGYKGGDVKGVYAGPALAYSIDKNWDLAFRGERDNHGNYVAVFQVVYGFGGKGVHSTLDNISGTEATPFPVGR